jgi:hypothetical protein
MKRGKGISKFPPQFYSRKQESIFCKPYRIVWRAYRYKSAKRQICHPVRVQRGLVMRLGTSVVVSRVSGGDYQFSGSVWIKSRRNMECRILGGFREGSSVTASESICWLLCIGRLLFGSFPELLVDSFRSAWRFPFETWRVVYECQDVPRTRVSCPCLSWLCRCRSRKYHQIGEFVLLIETSNQARF